MKSGEGALAPDSAPPNHLDEARASRATQRKPAAIARVFGAGAVLASLPFIQAVRDALGVGPGETWAAIGTTMIGTIVATALYYRVGEDARSYRIAASFEGLAYMALPLFLVFASGRGESIFWLSYLSYGAINGRAVENFRGILTVTAGAPLVLSLAFLGLRHDVVAAAFSLVAGLTGTSLLLVVRRTSLRLAEVVAERGRLQEELAEHRALDERTRIARDLHDGIGANLSALAWRAQRIRADVGPEDPALAEEMGGLIERATDGIDELRSVVWAMRSPVKTWSELVAYVRHRAEELCAGHVTLEFAATEIPIDRSLPGETGLHVIRMVQEAVRNAVRHGAPTHITVTLSPGPPISIEIRDDGSGIPDGVVGQSTGGLSNLKQRAESLGGHVTVEAGRPGSRVQIELPGI
jgi:signal transduction histidine kinase